MTPSGPLEQWAEEISAAVTTLAAYSRTAGLLPQLEPPLDLEMRRLRIPPEAPQHVHTARRTILNTTTKIQQLMIEPEEYLQRLAVYVRLPHFIQPLVILSMQGPLWHALCHNQATEMDSLSEANAASSPNTSPAFSGYVISTCWPASPWRARCCILRSPRSP
jgi:hypothetical protein